MRIGGSKHGDDGWGVCDGERRRDHEEQRERPRVEWEWRDGRVERATGLQLWDLPDRELWCGIAWLGSGDCRARGQCEGERREWDEWSGWVGGSVLWAEHAGERRVDGDERRGGHGDEQRGDEHLDREWGEVGRERCAGLHVGVGEKREQRADRLGYGRGDRGARWGDARRRR